MVKKREGFFHCFGMVERKGIENLDLFKIIYQPLKNELLICSRTTNQTFILNIDDMINFIQDNKDIIFCQDPIIDNVDYDTDQTDLDDLFGDW